MQTWRRWLIADSAAVICQSAYRMHQGYCRVATFRAQWRASVRLNAWLKMKRGVMWYARETERRRVAAIMHRQRAALTHQSTVTATRA